MDKRRRQVNTPQHHRPAYRQAGFIDAHPEGVQADSKGTECRPWGGVVTATKRDSAIVTAWVSGGLALAGTIITVAFSTGLQQHTQPSGVPSPVPAASGATAGSAASVSSGPAADADLIFGRWNGGVNGATNFWLVLRSDGSYVFADTLDPSAYREGQTTLDGAIIAFHSTDLTIATYPWLIERSVVGDVLHIGIASYARR